MSQRTVQRLASKIPEDPLSAWLNRLDTNTRKANCSHFNRWLLWLRKQPGWEDVTPRQLLIRQLEAEDQYEVLDLAQQYVTTLVMRKSSKRKAYSVIRSFFLHNRCQLRDDPAFRVHGDKPPVQARLTIADILEACHAATVRYRSMILFKFQSFLDNERIIYMNMHCGDEIVKQMQMGICPIRFEVPGRKSSENDAEGTFYTLIGKDTIEALTQYFETERGWPKPGEPSWVYSDGSSIEKSGFESMWLRLFRHMGKIPKRKGPVGSRYGFNLHEMRDEATTYLHTHAKSENFDMDCVKFWCGQVGEIDPLKYDKFYKEIDYVTEQYRIAEKHLNIVSGKATAQRAEEGLRQELDSLRSEVKELRSGKHLGQLLAESPEFIKQFEEAFRKNFRLEVHPDYDERDSDLYQAIGEAQKAGNARKAAQLREAWTRRLEERKNKSLSQSSKRYPV